MKAFNIKGLSIMIKEKPPKGFLKAETLRSCKANAKYKREREREMMQKFGIEKEMRN